MKVCTLGIIYGMTPRGIATLLDLTETQVAALQHQFMSMFPQLHHALRETAASGAIRGYATTISGLRRYRARTVRPHPGNGTGSRTIRCKAVRRSSLKRQGTAWIASIVNTTSGS